MPCTSHEGVWRPAESRTDITWSLHRFSCQTTKGKLEKLWTSNNAKTFQTFIFNNIYIFFHKGDPRSSYTLCGAVFKKLYSYLYWNSVQWSIQIKVNEFTSAVGTNYWKLSNVTLNHFIGATEYDAASTAVLKGLNTVTCPGPSGTSHLMR